MAPFVERQITLTTDEIGTAGMDVKKKSLQVLIKYGIEVPIHNNRTSASATPHPRSEYIRSCSKINQQIDTLLFNISGSILPASADDVEI